MSYLSWHYGEVLSNLLLIYRNVMLFPIYYFSIPRHLDTLFSPWKRQRIHMKPGFHMDDFVTVVMFNITSRVLGAIMRTGTIICGLLLSVLFACIGAVPVIAWTIAIGLSFPLYLFHHTQKPKTPDELLQAARSSIKQLTLLLLANPAGAWTCQRLGMDAEKVRQAMFPEQATGDWKTFEIFLKKHGDTKTIAVLFETAVMSYPPFMKYLTDHGRSVEDIAHTVSWYETKNRLQAKPVLLDLETIKSLPGIGADWAYGYTVEFDRFARDITKLPTPYPLLIGREKELEDIERILVKTENPNVLLVGEPGVARHILLQTLAYRMSTGLCLPMLSHKRILLMDMHGVLAAKETKEAAKGFVSELLAEAYNAGNVIVAIDEIDRYIQTGDNGAVDVSDIIEKYTALHVPFIGIATPTSYHKYIETHPSLPKLFHALTVSPPAPQVLLKQLEVAVCPILEKKYGVIITYPALCRAIEDAERYLSTTPFPGKAIELLDEVCIFETTKMKTPIIQPQHIDDYLSEKFHTSIGKLQEGEKEKLTHLEDLLHARIVNQETAVKAIAGSLRRSRLNITSPKKPLGSFLFLGPTGVGKTETAKALAAIYFGPAPPLIRIDMSQYQKEEGLERLIGSIKLGTPGELTSKLRENPFSLLLLDEIEKANPEIYNLFLTLIDEGYISDSLGKRVDAKPSIIIATSNAGAESIREEVAKGKTGDALRESLLEYVQSKQIFSPEFLNRFDGVVVFTPLSEGHMREVAKRMLENLNKRLEKQKLSVAITDDLVAKLVPIGMDRQFGARAIARVISEKVEDQVAKRLLQPDRAADRTLHVSL